MIGCWLWYQVWLPGQQTLWITHRNKFMKFLSTKCDLQFILIHGYKELTVEDLKKKYICTQIKYYISIAYYRYSSAVELYMHFHSRMIHQGPYWWLHHRNKCNFIVYTMELHLFFCINPLRFEQNFADNILKTWNKVLVLIQALLIWFRELKWQYFISCIFFNENV